MEKKYLIYTIAFISFGLADLFYLNSKVIPTLWPDKKLTTESASEKTTKPEPNHTIAANKPDHGVKEEDNKENIPLTVTKGNNQIVQDKTNEMNQKEGVLEDEVAALTTDTPPTDDTRDTKIEEKHTQSSMVTKIVVQYKTGEYELSPNYRKTLLSELKKVRISDKISITIDGHADRRGTGFFDNALLSQQRADFIAALLKQQGILEDQITAKGYGDSQPLDVNDTPKAYKKNRRAEIKIFKDKP